MTVDELLDRMTWTEFIRWNAYYSDDRGNQGPDQMKSALKASLAAGRKKKR
jgi:hypothetical protein